MKVLLINPPINEIIGLELPLWVKRHEGAFPPLGLLYVASYLKSSVHCEVKIVDALAMQMDVGGIERTVRAQNPDIIGISAHTHNLLDVISIARSIKRVNSRTHVCLGGPHALVFPRESISLEPIDSVIPQEGEKVFAELVKCIGDKSDLSKVQGILFKQQGKVIETDKAEGSLDLDRLPFPDRSLIDNNKYHLVLARKGTMTTIASSRGCPYHCSFCSTPRESYRMRSAENVVDEMQECVRLGIEEIHFVDDTFNVDVDRVEKICNELIRRRLRTHWSFRGRIDRLSLSLLKKVKQAGCYRIHVGVETATDEGLQGLRKEITVEQIRRVFQWTRQIRISTVAYFLIGCPHEKNRQDVIRTIGFSKELDPDFALFNVLMPYPGTTLYASGLAKGLFSRDFWREFARHPHRDFQPIFWQEWLSRDELVHLLDYAYRSFYLRPGVAWRILSTPCHPAVFLQRLASGCKILQSALGAKRLPI